jgi:hypothetical protein
MKTRDDLRKSVRRLVEHTTQRAGVDRRGVVTARGGAMGMAFPPVVPIPQTGNYFELDVSALDGPDRLM